MIALVRGSGGPSDLRDVDPAPEFFTTREQEAAARRVVLAHCGNPSDILELLGLGS